MSKPPFLKVTESGGRYYAYLARSVRAGRKVDTEIVRKLGRIPLAELDQVRDRFNAASRALWDANLDSSTSSGATVADLGAPVTARVRPVPVTTQRSRVNRIVKTNRSTWVYLERGNDLELSPFAYIKAGDTLTVTRDEGGRLLTVEKQVSFSPRGTRRTVTIYPPYERAEKVSVPPEDLRVTFRERRSTSDWKEGRKLERFHYRGKGLNRIVGRRSVIVADAEGIGVIGYAVLSSTVAAAKPRYDLFETNFTKQMKSRLINKILRIPRIVVHPEFRGMGIGARLARHAVAYARDHWDINGYKPILVEVIASMTDYHRFFEVAGFVPLGSTEGRGQIAPAYGRNGWQERPNSANYDFFVPRGPKPYLAYPLSAAVAARVADRSSAPNRPAHLLRVRPRMTGPIRVNAASLGRRGRRRLTARAREVLSVFGMEKRIGLGPSVRAVSLTVAPGDVVLISGASGSGKSTLLSAISPHANALRGVHTLSGRITRPRGVRIATLQIKWSDRRPLIDLVGQDLGRAIFVLNEVGLAEAHLYLRSPSQLSDGQRYRFGLARLCDTRAALWTADEFASGLDPRASAIVSKGLRRLASIRGATVLVASPHPSAVCGSLLPTQRVDLRWGGDWVRWAAHLRVRLRRDYLEMRATNEAPSTLTGVTVEATLWDGSRVQLAACPELKGNERSQAIRINLVDLERYTSLRMFSDQGVGDVRYVARLSSDGEAPSIAA